MPIPTPKLNVTSDSVKADITNTIAVLTALDRVIPGKLDAAVIEALTAIENNEFLLTLLTFALSKV